jgi:hypothetical protein
MFGVSFQSIVSHTNGLGPEVSVDGRGPPLARVDEHRPGVVLQLTDASLCHAVLEVSVHSAKWERLATFYHCLSELVVREATVVGVVVESTPCDAAYSCCYILK